jgi:uncharacterized protein with LGFP repeats
MWKPVILAALLLSVGMAARAQAPMQSACDFRLGPAIFAKWQTLSKDGIFGCPLNSEGEATASPKGTTGRWAQFLGGPQRQGGYIIAVTSGPDAGAVYEVNGCISTLYQNFGNSGGVFGFPVSDEHDAPNGRRSDFEGGYISWDAASGRCAAHPGAAKPE